MSQWDLFDTTVCHNLFSVPRLFCHINDFEVCELCHIIAREIRGIAIRRIIGRVYSNILSLLQPTSLYLGHVIAFPVLQTYYTMENRLGHQKNKIIVLYCQLELEFHV